MFDEKSLNIVFVVVLCMVLDEVIVQDLVVKVLVEKLAVCVILIFGVIFFYYWEGKLE